MNSFMMIASPIACRSESPMLQQRLKKQVKFFAVMGISDSSRVLRDPESKKKFQCMDQILTR